MKVKVPMMVDDPRFAPDGRGRLDENIVVEDAFFLDGPVTRRVAVLDFNSDTGALEPGARYVPPKTGNKLGKYDLSSSADIVSRAFNQVSVFATVFKAIQLFEKPDTLGRQIDWAFGAPQLLVVPRAGRLENAVYDRDSHSIQFYYFPNPLDPKGEGVVYTSLARDVVAHETGHALLDGIAPHLWDACTPQCLALHEAVGDLSALLVSLDSTTLRKAVLEKTGGSIKDATHFSALAEEFGMAHGTGALRDLLNSYTMRDFEHSDPHLLCQVLTGALYTVLVKMHEDRKHQRMEKKGVSELSASGWALAVAADQFRRMTLRALDYLPPGEISFADYGRAIIAADRASHPDDPQEREWIKDEFVARGMAPDRAAMEAALPDDDLSGIDLAELMVSDSAAYRFAFSERGRRLLGIPEGAGFWIEPRRAVEKLFYHRAAPGADQAVPTTETVREGLFKVWWYHEEENALGGYFPSTRQIAVGTTLVWDRDTSKLRVLLTSDPRAHPQEQEAQQTDRDLMLRQLAADGLLRSDRKALGPDGRRSELTVNVKTDKQAMRVSSVARMLHLAWEV